MTNEARLFIKAYRKGLLCVHPTDTLWGLTCDLKKSKQQLFGYKGFTDKRKGFVHLVADIDSALRLWQPLPGSWPKILEQLWPAPLTVVWQKHANRAGDGTLALRVPALPQDCAWFKDCLAELGPIISTSVNLSGQQPLSRQEICETLADDQRFYLPATINRDCCQSGQASTVIVLKADGKFRVLRYGAFSIETLKNIHHQNNN